MNLLELMLENKVVWPVGAGYAVQDDDGMKVKFGYGRPPTLCTTGIWHREVEVAVVPIRGLASDWATSIITKNQYYVAGGWMEWKGGECPVPKEAPILYTTKVVTAEPCRAGACSWEHIGNDSDILAYRLTAIIPGRNPKETADALAQIYIKLGVTTLEEALAEIDKGIPTSMGHTIVHGPDTFKDCTILLKSKQTVVWVHNGKEHISPITEVVIDPSEDELVAYLLSGLCKVQIDPAHIAEVRDQVNWFYQDND